MVHQAVVLVGGPCRLAKVRRPTQVEKGWAFTGSYYETYSREAAQRVRMAQRVARILGGPEGNLRLQPNWEEIISNIEDKSDKFYRGKKNCSIAALRFWSTSFYLRFCLVLWRYQAEDCIYSRYPGYGRMQPNHLEILPHYRLARGVWAKPMCFVSMVFWSEPYFIRSLITTWKEQSASWWFERIGADAPSPKKQKVTAEL